MIQSKKDLIRYLKMDKYALGYTKKHPSPFDEIWEYEIVLRKHEYYINCTNNYVMQLFY
jgi:serine O-acetyltransferase